MCLRASNDNCMSALATNSFCVDLILVIYPLPSKTPRFPNNERWKGKVIRSTASSSVEASQVDNTPHVSEGAAWTRFVFVNVAWISILRVLWLSGSSFHLKIRSINSWELLSIRFISNYFHMTPLFLNYFPVRKTFHSPYELPDYMPARIILNLCFNTSCWWSHFKIRREFQNVLKLIQGCFLNISNESCVTSKYLLKLRQIGGHLRMVPPVSTGNFLPRQTAGASKNKHINITPNLISYRCFGAILVPPSLGVSDSPWWVSWSLWWWMEVLGRRYIFQRTICEHAGWYLGQNNCL